MPSRVPPGEPLASAREVSVELGGRRVLDAAGIVVCAGEMVALVGPNGAGKSTLLNVLSGDLDPVRGEVAVAGEPLAAWSSTELAMRRAVLPQQVTVAFPFTVRDVVRMGRAPWGRTPLADGDDAAVAEALEQTDTAHLASRAYPSLSGGERARVALARVCAQRAQLMLLDEPTAALDVHHQELVLGLARRRSEAGDGIVVVLHDLGSAARHADRVVLIHGGQVVADGTPTEVLEPAKLSAVYDHEIEVLTHPRTGALLVVPGPTPTGLALST